MSAPESPKPSFRVCAVIFWLLIFGLAIFAHGWLGWTEGSVFIKPKNALPFTATPNANATSFYVYTLGFMAVGLLAVMGGLVLVWALLFGSESRKSTVMAMLAQPVEGRRIPVISSWFFWVVIAFTVSILFYLSIQIS
ncbi:MAG: hypothetical protein E6Q78_15140 [Rhodoferax sp.]|nr:MAG: hypothetical protein E6Q78_15140 [Rhodoferax sp.]